MQTVLIVEDEKMIRQGLRVMLKRSGVPVETIVECNNGLTALEVLKTQKVDVMFTDIRMPKMDGIELVKQMQELPEKPLTVAISGYDDFSYAVEMLRNGVKEYLLKPVDRDKMKEVLQRLEEELQQTKKEDAYFRATGCRQLRQLMLSDSVSEQELAAFRERLEGTLLFPAYYVCCLEKGADVPRESEDCLCLEETDRSGILIVSGETGPFLWKNELRDCFVGVSGLHHGIGQLRCAWQEATDARKRAFLGCRHTVCTGETTDAQTPEDGQTGGIPDAEAIQKIVQRMGTDRIKDAVSQVEQFGSRLKREIAAADSLEAFVTALTDKIREVYQNALGEQEEGLQRLSCPWAYACLEEYLTELTDWMFAFHDKIDTKFDDYRNRQKVAQALSYIQENYSSDLNMAVVSNHVSMNYSLFSYVFKQYVGKNFVSYLKQLRMEEAKRLLTDTRLRVNEISQQVGYENEKHFMKLFKAECGVSPTEYRKNMELGKES